MKRRKGYFIVQKRHISSVSETKRYFSYKSHFWAAKRRRSRPKQKTCFFLFINKRALVSHQEKALLFLKGHFWMQRRKRMHQEKGCFLASLSRPKNTFFPVFETKKHFLIQNKHYKTESCLVGGNKRGIVSSKMQLEAMNRALSHPEKALFSCVRNKPSTFSSK